MRLKEECRNTEIIRKSKFIACARQCRTEEECRSYIEAVRKEYSDATHVCTAYICGENDRIQHSSDNHEPSGTAGIPMLEALKHSGLSDTCVCVVRYFGGIKLGPGGLIRAYSSAVTNVLANAKKVEEIPLHCYTITYAYDLSGPVEGWLRRNTEIIDLQYSESITAVIETERDDIPVQIRDLSHGQAAIIDSGIVYKEKEI